jgi:hypothetical protein
VLTRCRGAESDGAVSLVEDVATAPGLPDVERGRLHAAGVMTLHVTPVSGPRSGHLGTIVTFAVHEVGPAPRNGRW